MLLLAKVAARSKKMMEVRPHMSQYSTESDPEHGETCLSIMHISPENRSSPVAAMTVYKGQIARVYRVGSPNGFAPPGRKEGDIITYLTRQARQRMFVRIATSDVTWRSMLTLTFPDECTLDGKDVKFLLNRFLEWHRYNFKGHSYFWFLEFTKRGRPHVHVITSQAVSKKPRVRFARFWSELLDNNLKLGQQVRAKVYRVHVHNRQWTNLREKDGAIRYVAKYAHKTYQKHVPENYQNVGRFWGCSKDVKPVEIETVPIDEDTIRAILNETDHPAKDYEHLPKYLYGLKLE